MNASRLAAVVAGGLLLVSCAGPSPAEQEAAYLRDAQPADERLAADTASAIRLGERICADLARGIPRADVVAEAQRITGGEGYLEPDAATRVVEVAERHLCPDGATDSATE